MGPSKALRALSAPTIQTLDDYGKRKYIRGIRLVSFISYINHNYLGSIDVVYWQLFQWKNNFCLFFCVRNFYSDMDAKWRCKICIVELVASFLALGWYLEVWKKPMVFNYFYDFRYCDRIYSICISIISHLTNHSRRRLRRRLNSNVSLIR